jgi:flagellar L-ring protein precursor FlgH
MNKRFSWLSKLPLLALALLGLPCGQASAGLGSLWTDNSAQPRSMFADKKAHTIGDIVTIVIQENNGATRNNNTTTSKKASADASIASFLYSPTASSLLTKGGVLPALKYTQDNEFNGGGQINNQETINAQLSVRVIDVLPNGNLVIEGHRQTSFAGEKQDAILRGTIRADDVTPANTILSSQVADATIQFVNNGAITDNQRRGWFTTIWEKLTPF